MPWQLQCLPTLPGELSIVDLRAKADKRRMVLQWDSKAAGTGTTRMTWAGICKMCNLQALWACECLALMTLMTWRPGMKNSIGSCSSLTPPLVVAGSGVG